jgi:hypothetical protein
MHYITRTTDLLTPDGNLSTASSDVIRTAHLSKGVFMCLVSFKIKSITSLNGINWLVCVKDMNRVLCVVRTKFLCAVEMDQAVCHQSLNAEVWHLFQDSQSWISFEGCKNGRGFPLSTSISPCQQHYTNIPRSLSSYCHFHQKEKQAKSFFYRVALDRKLLSSVCVSIRSFIFLLHYIVS